MKRIAAMFLCAIMLLSLCACGKSKEAQAVDDLILSIGEVSLDSAEKIETAESAYATLSDKDKEKIESYSVLKTARETFDDLSKERQEAVDTMFKLIDSSFSAGKMEAAKGLCYELLNNDKMPLTDTEIEKTNQILRNITEYCFAGTYLVIPKYVIDVPYEEGYISDIGYLLKGGLGGIVSCTYEFDTKYDLDLAIKRYKSYLDANFEYITSEYYPTGSEKYIYGNGSVSFAIELNKLCGEDIDMYEIYLVIAVNQFDLSKIDTSKTDLTITDSLELLVK